MQYGMVLPVTDPTCIAELSAEAEQAEWDGVFIAELIYGPDAWVSLTAAAMKTDRIKLGTMLTPISRMRPWKLASETATLDLISNGRVILAVGLGAIETGFAEFGEQTDRKTRAELMDEGLEIVCCLWSGEPFAFKGKHYTIDTTGIPDTMSVWYVSPVQRPRIPIWITGAWRRERSMQRALRFDGLLPNVFDESGGMRPAQPDDVRAMRAYASEGREAGTPYDIIMEGETPDNGEESIARVKALEEAGATWWIESPWSRINELDFVRQRIAMGPPKS